MALLRNIHNKNIWWRYNNKPYVEPTEQQKAIQAKQDEIRRLESKKAYGALASMLETIEAMSPEVFEKTSKMMKNASMF